MSLDNEAGAKESIESDDQNDWTFLDGQKDISKVEDANDIENENSPVNSEEIEDDHQTDNQPL